VCVCAGLCVRVCEHAVCRRICYMFEKEDCRLCVCDLFVRLNKAESVFNKDVCVLIA